MSSHNINFLIFLFTIFVTRIWLFYYPISSPIIKGFHLHHYMYGLFAFVFSIIIHNAIIYSIGMALFIDELTFIIIHGKSWKDYNSKISLMGTAFFIGVVYIFRYYFLK